MSWRLCAFQARRFNVLRDKPAWRRCPAPEEMWQWLVHGHHVGKSSNGCSVWGASRYWCTDPRFGNAGFVVSGCSAKAEEGGQWGEGERSVIDFLPFIPIFLIPFLPSQCHFMYLSISSLRILVPQLLSASLTRWVCPAWITMLSVAQTFMLCQRFLNSFKYISLCSLYHLWAFWHIQELTAASAGFYLQHCCLLMFSPFNYFHYSEPTYIISLSCQALAEGFIPLTIITFLLFFFSFYWSCSLNHTCFVLTQ